jgi:hypothetical protein
LGFVINDIHRHWFAYHSIAWITKLFLKSYLVKHDAKLSVWRAFKKSEIVSLLEKAGIHHYRIRWRWAFRWEVVVKPTNYNFPKTKTPAESYTLKNILK